MNWQVIIYRTCDGKHSAIGRTLQKAFTKACKKQGTPLIKGMFYEDGKHVFKDDYSDLVNYLFGTLYLSVKANRKAVSMSLSDHAKRVTIEVRRYEAYEATRVCNWSNLKAKSDSYVEKTDAIARALLGKRIEIPVHFDMWIRGARFGIVTSIGKNRDFVCVKLDALPRKRMKIHRIDYSYIRAVE